MRYSKQASRLFALSITARERGDNRAADEFMKLAFEALERDEQPVVQQQQQAQAKKRKVSRLRRAHRSALAGCYLFQIFQKAVAGSGKVQGCFR